MTGSARTFRTGGIVPVSTSTVPLERGIWKATLPSVANIPLGAPGEDPAVCLVKPGDLVREGMVIGAAHGKGVPVHASIPGKVRGISNFKIDGGGEMPVVTIDLAGEFSHHAPGTLGGKQPTDFPPRDEILRLIRSMGVTESGRLEWNIAERVRVWAGTNSAKPRIIVAAFDPEPNLRTEQAVFAAYPFEIVLGLRVLVALMPNAQAIICTNYKTAQSTRAVQEIAGETGLRARYVRVAPKYPQHDENLLVETVLGRATPVGSGVADRGILTLNASTLVLIARAVIDKRPVIERSFTVSGSAIKFPRVVTARIGITVAEVLQECGGVAANIRKIVIGDSFRGRTVTDLSEPIERTTSGLLVLADGDIHEAEQTDCIQCGYCVQSCPVGLEPMRLFKLLQLGRHDQALANGIADCTQCGICSSVCPARLPLTQTIAGGMHNND